MNAAASAAAAVAGAAAVAAATAAGEAFSVTDRGRLYIFSSWLFSREALRAYLMTLPKQQVQ